MFKFRPCRALSTASVKTAFGYGCSAKLVCGYGNAQTVPSILSVNFSQLTHHRTWRQRPTFCRTISSSRVIPASNPDEILRNTFDSYVKKILADPSRLQHNIDARGLKISSDELIKRLQHLSKMIERKSTLEQQKKENAQLMKLIVKSKDDKQFSKQKEMLISRGQELRKELKQFMDSQFQVLYRQVMHEVLQLPTDVHPTTPTDDEIILEFGKKADSSANTLDHLSIAKKAKTLYYRTDVNDSAYYLVGSLADAELDLMSFVSESLFASGYQQMAGPDMIKGFVVDACCMEESQTLLLETGDELPATEWYSPGTYQRLLLPGTSCPVFVAYLTAVTVEEDQLPLTFFSVGPRYTPYEIGDELVGLYKVQQAQEAHAFGAGRNLQEAEDLFEKFFNKTKEIYDQLQVTSRFVSVSARNLERHESKRIDFLIWSDGFKRYFKCGELRLCNDYISERAGTTYIDSKNAERLLYNVHSTVLKVPSILASRIEREQRANISSFLRT